MPKVTSQRDLVFLSDRKNYVYLKIFSFLFLEVKLKYLLLSLPLLSVIISSFYHILSVSVIIFHVLDGY